MLQAANGSPVTSTLLEQARELVDDTAEDALNTMLGGEQVLVNELMRSLKFNPQLHYISLYLYASFKRYSFPYVYLYLTVLVG